jgi:hypothetical protein
MSAAGSVAPRMFTSDPGHREDEGPQSRDEALTPGIGFRQSLLVCVGIQHTTAVRMDAGQTIAYRIVSHGPALLAAAQAAAARASGPAAARVIRAAAEQVVDRGRLEKLFVTGCPVVATAGIASAVITLAGGVRATTEQIQVATDRLGIDWARQRGSVEPMLIGAAMLGAILARLGADEIIVERQVP